jgi:viroplasmin and RNaseH domain-containing protein
MSSEVETSLTVSDTNVKPNFFRDFVGKRQLRSHCNRGSICVIRKEELSIDLSATKKAMEIIRDSSLEEFSRQFWEREARKNQNGKDVVAKIEAGGDAYEWLKEKHDYKLPRNNNNIVEIARLARDEVGALLMREDTVNSENAWARKRGLVPDPFTQV